MLKDWVAELIFVSNAFFILAKFDTKSALQSSTVNINVFGNTARIQKTKTGFKVSIIGVRICPGQRETFLTEVVIINRISNIHYAV